MRVILVAMMLLILARSGQAQELKAQDLVWNYFKAQRDAVNRASLTWNYANKADWEKLRDEKIARLKASLGTFPETPTHVSTHVTKKISGEGFVIENIVYESRPGFWVTANLYRPEVLPKSLPIIVIVHSHHNPKTEGELQDMGVLWARAGCYVLVPDLLGHGERRQHSFHTAKDYPKQFKVGRQDYYFRYNTGLQLSLIGESLAGWMAWDLMRGLDVLLGQPNADPSRTALLGSVAGGGDIAAITAALDRRFQVVAPFNFGGPQPETIFPLPQNAEEAFNYLGGGSWESTRNIRNTGSDGFLPWIIVASVAPRAIVHSHEFAWDREHDPSWKRYQTIMGFYDSQDKLAFTHGRGSVKGTPPESTHCNNIGVEHRKMLHPFLNRVLQIQATESSQRFPAADLQCWTPELKQKLQPKMVHELIQVEMASKQQAEQAAFDRKIQELRQKFKAPAKFQALPPKETVSSVILTSNQGSLPIYVTLLHPAQDVDGPMRVVVGVSQEGQEKMGHEHRQTIEQLRENGILVMLVDLPGNGVTKIGSSRGRTSYATSVSATAQMFGTSLLELRLQALHETLHHVKHWAGKRKLRIALWGDSFARPNHTDQVFAIPYDVDPFPRLGEPLGGLLALLTPLVSDVPIDAVYLHGGLLSFKSLVESPFLYVPHDAIQPSLASWLDLDEAARRLAPRPLRMEGLIDGLNVQADTKAMERVYSRTTTAYQEHRDRFQLQQSRTAELAAWFDQALAEK